MLLLRVETTQEIPGDEGATTLSSSEKLFVAKVKLTVILLSSLLSRKEIIVCLVEGALTENTVRKMCPWELEKGNNSRLQGLSEGKHMKHQRHGLAFFHWIHEWWKALPPSNSLKLEISIP